MSTTTLEQQNIIKRLNERNREIQEQARTLDATKAEARSTLEALTKEHAENCATIAAEAQRLQLLAAEAPAPEEQLSEGDARSLNRFNLGKLLRHLKAHARGAHSTLDGVEAEMVREGEREARAAGIESSGVILPRVLVRRTGAAMRGIERRDINATGSAEQGGTLIATEKRGLADDFFNASVIAAAGATVIEDLVGNLDLPRLHASTTKPKGKGEVEAADKLDPTFAQLSLTPKRLSAYIPFTDQFARQRSDSIEALIRKYLTEELLGQQEIAFFHGTGTKEAEGLANTTGIASVTSEGGTGAPTWEQIVALETSVDVKNALLGNLHYITNSRVKGLLKQTKKGDNTAGIYLLDGNGDLLNGYKPYYTNAISADLGSTKDRSALFFGNCSDYIIGYWGGLELEVVRDVEGAKTGTSTVVISAFYDGGVLRPKSFAAQLDLKA